MQTVNIKYVGVKESEDAFKDQTNLIWFQGSVHPIQAPTAARMLRHPDVFALADEPSVAEAAAPAPVAGQATATGKPTPAAIANAKALLAAAGLAVVDPSTPQAPSLNGVTLPVITPAPSPAPSAPSADVGLSDAKPSSPVQETAAPASDAADGMRIGAGSTVGSADAPAPAPTPAPTPAPSPSPAAAKATGKAKR